MYRSRGRSAVFKTIMKGLTITLVIALGASFLFSFVFGTYNKFNARYSDGDSYAITQLNGKVYYCNDEGVQMYDEVGSLFVCDGNSVKTLGDYLVVNNSLGVKNELYLYEPVSREKISIYKTSFWESFWSDTYVSSFFVDNGKVYYFINRGYSSESEVRCYDTADGIDKPLISEKKLYSMSMDEDTNRLFLLRSNTVCMYDAEGNLLDILALKLTDEDGGAFELCAENGRLYVETNNALYVYNTDDLSATPTVIGQELTGGRFYLLSANNGVVYGVKYTADATGLYLSAVDTKSGTVTDYIDTVLTDDIIEVSSYRPTVIDSIPCYIINNALHVHQPQKQQ